MELPSGETLFVKGREDAAAGEPAAEAAGLEWIGEGGVVPVPRVVAVGDSGGVASCLATCKETRHTDADSPSFLALEWIEPGRLDRAGAERLGRELAAMHRLGAPSFGWMPTIADDGRQRIGSLPVPIEQREVWPSFYAEVRILPLVALATERGGLSAEAARSVESVCERIEELCGPPEPPARLHGDLWGGNVLAGADGRAWLIDPAAHGGHREVDLAMLRLFANPGERVFAAYEEAFPLAGGAAERVPLYQLWPLLVHAILFGGHYASAVEQAASRYA